MQPFRKGRSSPGRRRGPWCMALAWACFWLLGGQLVAVAFLEWRHPEFLDPKYGWRMAALRALRRHQPGRMLLVALGSSRAEQGFRPGALLNDTNQRGPLFYNLARGGSSPLMYLLTLRRLLRDGVRPDAVLVELFPPALVEEGSGTLIFKMTLRDFPVLRRYPVSGSTYGLWLRDRLLLWSQYRSGFLAWAAPSWLSPQARWGDHLWDYRGGEWRLIGEGVPPSEHRRLTEDAHQRYGHALQNFRIAAGADRALRDLLRLCRRQHIGVVLFVMPESSEFRGWYSPLAQRRFADYLAALARDHGVPLVDARCWNADEDFSDGHHLLQQGATAFTRRFVGAILSGPVWQPRIPADCLLKCSR